MPNRRVPPVRAVRRSLLTVAMGSLLAACGESVTQIDGDDVAGLRVSIDSAEIAIGGVLQLHAYPLDSKGALLVGLGVSWQSVDLLVAAVDEAGLVTGVAAGTANVIAQIGITADTTVVSVGVPPALSLSADSIAFDVVAGTADPAPDSIQVTNTGGLTLRGLTVDSIVYGAGANGWLTTAFDSDLAPANLEFTAVTATITTAGIYVASVWLSATAATGSPAEVTVTLDVAPGAPASGAYQIFAGNNQTATTGTSVTTSPTVVLRDQFDNPVPGATITFAASGAGSAAPTSVITDSLGRASTTWTLDVTGHTMGANGTYQNTLTASATGLSSLGFTGFAVYSYATHVNPIWTSAPNCTGCHTGGGFSGLALSGAAGTNYGVLVNAGLTCDAALAESGYRRVAPGGGVNAADEFSVLMRLVDPGLSFVGTCGDGSSHGTKASAANLTILRAWIRNGAPNN